MRTPAALSIGAAAGLGIGLALGLWLAGDGPDAADEARRLEQALARSSSENEALRDRVTTLEIRLSDASLEPASESRTDDIEADDTTSAADASAPDGAAEEAAFREVEGGSAFDEARLLALGFHPTDVERLRRAWEALELEKLYIQDERARSSHRDGRHWARFVALERDMIAELGQEEYDALLYASGGRNRVRVRNVLPESAADGAGLAPGDEVLSYDGEPIYRMMALKQATVGCERGRTVALGVLQDGVERRVWVPCGPLGIELEMVNAEPR